jgi:hypothetical protein
LRLLRRVSFFEKFNNIFGALNKKIELHRAAGYRCALGPLAYNGQVVSANEWACSRDAGLLGRSSEVGWAASRVNRVA